MNQTPPCPPFYHYRLTRLGGGGGGGRCTPSKSGIADYFCQILGHYFFWLSQGITLKIVRKGSATPDYSYWTIVSGIVTICHSSQNLAWRGQTEILI